MHSIRVISIDSYQATPIPDVDPTFSQFRGNEIKQVPVIRIFGITLSGEKVCLHIHGVFPYLYVPYAGQMKADIMAYQLAASLDAAINISLGSAKANIQHIYKIQQVSGTPFYGYHREKHHFFKIYFYNPAMMKRAIDLLQSGCILDQSFQPHEAHIQYTLQFMIDYNVYGMSTMDLKNVKHRHPSSTAQNEESLSSSSNEILSSELYEKEYLPHFVTRQSVCELEIDAWAVDILNRKVIDKGIDLNPGIAIIWEEEKARRAQAGLGGESQLTYPSSPERTQAASILTDNDVYHKNRLIQRLCTIESQGDESSLTPNSETSSYPIPVPDNSNLLDASQLEIHAGPFDSAVQKSINQLCDTTASESIVSTLQSQVSFSDISLNSSDLNIADMLASLARNQDNDDIPSSIDSNSILGSQKSQSYQSSQLEENKDAGEEEEEDEEVPDLNLTNLQLDSLNFSSWDTNEEKSQPNTNKSDHSQIELVLESLDDPAQSNLSNDIPQFDGPIDDENVRASGSKDDVDVTIERQEFVICEYKSRRGRARSTSVTPRKRKRILSSDDEDSNDSLKRKITKDQLPKTPRRTPSKRSSKLTSPSCPSRTYSPLNVEITSGPKTPKNSPRTSPTKTPGRRNIRESFRRKRIFSPVKELNLEEECEEKISSFSEVVKSCVEKERQEKNQSSTDSEPIKPSIGKDHEENSSIDSEDIKPCSKTSKELFTQVEKLSERNLQNVIEKFYRKTPFENSPIKEDHPDSDVTLVEDSDESLDTVVSSPPANPIIINESDSNDSHSNDRQSNLPSYSFPHNTLQPVLEEEEVIKNEVPQFIESRQKALFSQSFSLPSTEGLTKEVAIRPNFSPPSREEIENCMEFYGIDKCRNVQPFFSEQADADTLNRNQPAALQKTRDLASILPFRSSVEGIIGIDELRKMKGSEFHFSGAALSSTNLRREFASHETVIITPLKLPPDRESVELWLKARKKQQKEDEKHKIEESGESEAKTSQKSETSDSSVDAPFSLSKIFKGVDTGSDGSIKHLGISCGQIEFNTRSSINVEDENMGNAKALTTYQYLTILCLEVHVITRPGLLPDPRYDAIAAIFYAIHNDVPPDYSKAKPLDSGVIIVDPHKVNVGVKNTTNANFQQQSLMYVENEEALFDGLVSIIQRSDPEILIGWDIEFLSWGYIFQRASLLGKNLSGKISRIPNAKCNWETGAHDQSMAEIHLEILAELKMPGRIVLDIWRLMRHEIALTSYTYENVMFHVMNERIPYSSFDTLTQWWNTANRQWRVIDCYANKVIGIHRMLHHLDIINRTSEHARLYGIQFFEVFSRGSQFRVESMMLRLAKPLNYIPVSPSAHQRGCMRAPESLPLIMEPESTMYSDPVVVLDFQSLYPSIIIAYNYCFSTCLGRIEHIGSPQPFEFGATTLKVPKNLALKLKNKMNFAPCGVAFVKKEVRKGILPRMLTEILDTRLMVKKAIKDHSKENRALQRALHSRQLGLKLIANVTYGYTAANFSGRMPCIEVGDSVVSKGKETLERAIKIVESTPKWGARVVYGDTDSLFVLLKGKSREEAFEIGAEIADVVTAANPKPVKLKFEKVMQPCILQTKKRYCGYMYENLNDKPVYLAKGIETVRRDGCPAVTKILEKSLRILFDTKDVSLVKQYVTRQLDKVLSGKASIQDLTFAKEFRGMRGYKAAACVPALELTRRLIQKDPRAVPRAGSRVPYIIVAGGPNEPLIRCVRSPMELICDPYLRPNATYYVTKVIIPPLNRCLNLIGVDAHVWFMEMPHRQALNRVPGGMINSNRKQKTTISQYLYNTTCPSCGQNCDKGICADCVNKQSQTLVILHEKCRQYERIYSNIKIICESCIGVMDADSCISLDCPIFYRRIQAQRDNSQISHLYNLIECMEHLI